MKWIRMKFILNHKRLMFMNMMPVGKLNRYEGFKQGLTSRFDYHVGPERKNSPERCKRMPDNTEISKLKLKLKLTPKPVLFRANCLESETSYLNRDDSRTTTSRLFAVLFCFGIINETR